MNIITKTIMCKQRLLEIEWKREMDRNVTSSVIFCGDNICFMQTYTLDSYIP